MADFWNFISYLDFSKVRESKTLTKANYELSKMLMTIRKKYDMGTWIKLQYTYNLLRDQLTEKFGEIMYVTQDNESKDNKDNKDNKEIKDNDWTSYVILEGKEFYYLILHSSNITSVKEAVSKIRNKYIQSNYIITLKNIWRYTQMETMSMFGIYVDNACAYCGTPIISQASNTRIIINGAMATLCYRCSD